jgi:hypothetical protein
VLGLLAMLEGRRPRTAAQALAGLRGQPTLLLPRPLRLASGGWFSEAPDGYCETTLRREVLCISVSEQCFSSF